MGTIGRIRVTPEQEQVQVKPDQLEVVQVNQVIQEAQLAQQVDPVLFPHMGVGGLTGMTRTLEGSLHLDWD